MKPHIKQRQISPKGCKAATVIVGLLVLAACGGNAKSNSTIAEEPRPSNSPVQTAKPNAPDQTPAFPAQTRAPELSSNPPPQVHKVATGLSSPWSIAFLPDGRLLISERPGTLRVITQAGEVSEPIEGVPEVVNAGQGGLLDVSLSPDFGDSRWVYFSYAEPRGNGENGTSVARGRLSADAQRLEDFEVIFRQIPAWNSNLHFGSRLVWDREGRLYVTLGERSHSDARVLAQDTSTHLGKVVRIRPDGSVPADNPFVSKDGADEVWSYGHRNIQGAALHPNTGELWTIEHGPRGGDELNRPQAGENYGWPVITYGVEYSGAPVDEGLTKKEGMEQPLYYWDPVIAPSGMTFYTGNIFKQWQGDLLIGSLKPGGLVRLVLDGDKVIGEERLLRELGRVRDVVQGPDGAVWLATDGGELLKLTL